MQISLHVRPRLLFELHPMNRRSFLGTALCAAAAVAAPQRPPATSSSLTARLLRSLEALDPIDTHEHIIPEAERVSGKADFFTLASHYLLDDLTSAGLPRASRTLIDRPDTAEGDKWRLFE